MWIKALECCERARDINYAGIYSMYSATSRASYDFFSHLLGDYEMNKRRTQYEYSGELSNASDYKVQNALLFNLL